MSVAEHSGIIPDEEVLRRNTGESRDFSYTLRWQNKVCLTEDICISANWCVYPMHSQYQTWMGSHVFRRIILANRFVFLSDRLSDITKLFLERVIPQKRFSGSFFRKLLPGSGAGWEETPQSFFSSCPRITQPYTVLQKEKIHRRRDLFRGSVVFTLRRSPRTPYQKTYPPLQPIPKKRWMDSSGIYPSHPSRIVTFSTVCTTVP